MPQLPFASDSYDRVGFGVPQSRLHNMYVEETPAGPGRGARFCRPGLVSSYSIGTGPIKGLYAADGVFNGDIFAVSGTRLYRAQSLVGTVTDGDLSSMAGSDTQLGVVIGGDLWVYDGSTLTQQTHFYVQAEGIFTLTGNVSNGETVTIGSTVYTFKTAVSAANDVKVGDDAGGSIDNLVAAIMAADGEGTIYGTGTVANTQVTASATDDQEMTATAIEYGVSGMSIATTDTCANGSWSSPTLTGVDELPPFSGIEYEAGRFYLTVSDSDQYYWAELSDLTKIDALSFATAESSPDRNVAIKRLGDEVWFFGTQTVEPWYQTGDADQPLQRAQGRRYEKGCAAAQTVVCMDNTLFFLGNDGLVYRGASVPIRVSTHGIEFEIGRCTDVANAWAYTISFAGHSFYVLNLPNVGTYVYDAAKSQWSQWSSYGLTTFRAANGLMVNGVPYLGSAVDGTVYTLSDEVNSDDGGPISCLATALLPNPAGKLTNYSLMLQCNRGLGKSTGVYVNPVVEMCYSDDQGRTWSLWRQASLGRQGEYSFKAIWRRLGTVNSPGRLYEFRVTDPVPIVFEYVTYNEGRP